MQDCCTKSTTGSFRLLASSVCGSPQAGCVSQAPHTAAVFDVKRGGASLVPALLIALAGWVCNIVSAAAAEALYQVMEQVTGKEHIDPGITAAVKASKQHGDDEGHVYKERKIMPKLIKRKSISKNKPKNLSKITKQEHWNMYIT